MWVRVFDFRAPLRLRFAGSCSSSPRCWKSASQAREMGAERGWGSLCALLTPALAFMCFFSPPQREEVHFYLEKGSWDTSTLM